MDSLLYVRKRIEVLFPSFISYDKSDKWSSLYCKLGKEQKFFFLFIIYINAINGQFTVSQEKNRSFFFLFIIYINAINIQFTGSQEKNRSFFFLFIIYINVINAENSTVAIAGKKQAQLSGIVNLCLRKCRMVEFKNGFNDQNEFLRIVLQCYFNDNLMVAF